MKKKYTHAITQLGLEILIVSAIVCTAFVNKGAASEFWSVSTLANELQLARQVDGALSRAEAHVRAGELRLRENRLSSASYEFEQARQIFNRDIKPVLHYSSQTHVQGGMVLMSTQMSGITVRARAIEQAIKQAERTDRQISTQQQLERYNRALSESRTVLQPIQPATRISPEPRSFFYSWDNRSFSCHEEIKLLNFEVAIQRSVEELLHKGESFRRALLRANSLFPRVTSILRDEGVPEFLAYVALLESGYQLEAKSISGQAGLWQFSVSRARQYGLAVNAVCDERFQLSASTRAFVRYMARLYQRHGSWIEAIAAFSPKLNYLARIIAANRIANNPQHYGFYLDLYNITGRYDLLLEGRRGQRFFEPDCWDAPVYR